MTNEELLRQYVSTLVESLNPVVETSLQKFFDSFRKLPDSQQDLFWNYMLSDASETYAKNLRSIRQAYKSSSVPKLSTVTVSYFLKDAQYVVSLLKKVGDVSTNNTGPFDSIAFADERGIGAIEPDNEEEKYIRRRLSLFFNDNVPLNKKDASLMQGLLKQGKYPDVIKSPTAPVLYRGIKKPDLQFLQREIGNEPPKQGTTALNYSYKPHRSVSSWTADISIARGFATPTDSYPYGIVMHAKPSSNKGSFISGPDGLYNVSNVEGEYLSEEESIGIGTIKVFRIDWKKRWHPWKN